MVARLRRRFVQVAILVVVAAACAYAWTRVVRPDPTLLARLAAERLQAIFGPRVSWDDVRIDLVDGVVVEGLRVHSPAAPEPTLRAARVDVRHDVVALASGIYQPEEIRIHGARIFLHETTTGLAPDFPFELSPTETGGPVPRITVRDSEIFFRAMEQSPRFQPRTVLQLGDLMLDVFPRGGDLLVVKGTVVVRELGHDDVPIVIEGTAHPRADRIDLRVIWDPLRIDETLLHVLADDVAAEQRESVRGQGRLVVHLERDPSRRQGELRIGVTWQGEVRSGIGAFPGAQNIDARTREQIEALLGRTELDVTVTEEGVSVEGLASALGGTVRAQGHMDADGEGFHLVVEVQGMRLEDPAVRAALGPEGAVYYDAFDPSGSVDATIILRRDRGEELRWEVDAILENASFRYVGVPDPDGTPAGFPYPVHFATGRLRITPERLEFEDVVGFNGQAVVRLLGKRRRSWTGGETGRILFTPRGADVRLTVDGTAVPVDRDLHLAVAGSEFANIFERFRLEGILDKVEVDLVLEPGRDRVAVAEVRLTVEDERFLYRPFPLWLEQVKGELTLRRPWLEAEGRRGRVFAFDMRGRSSGAPVHAWATIVEHESRGRLQVEAEGVPLEGDVAKTILEAEATRGGLGPVWRYLDPRGRADVRVDLPLSDDPGPVRVALDLHGASVRLGADRARHPLEIADMSGRIEAEDDVVVIRGMQGRIRGSAVSLDGRIEGGPEGRWDLTLEADALRVDADLLAALRELTGEGLLPGGLVLEPEGRLSLRVHLLRPAGPAGRLEADVVATELEGTLRLPEGTRLALRGRRIQVEGEDLVLEDVHAEGPGISVHIEEGRLGPEGIEGRFHVRLEAFRTSEDLLALLPAEVREFLERWVGRRNLSSQGLRVVSEQDGRIVIRGELVLLVPEGLPPDEAPRGALAFAPLVVGAREADGHRTLSGLVRFLGLSLEPTLPVQDLEGEATLETLRVGPSPSGHGVVAVSHARIGDVRVRDLVVPLAWVDGILEGGPVRGLLAEGALEGRFRVHTREPTAYEGDACVTGFSLASLRQDLAPTGPAWTGTGRAAVRFQNRGGRARDLIGSGEIRIREGNLGDLPVIANVFVLLSRVLGVQDPPRFERADVDFLLCDEVIHFKRLDLAGPLFEMPGSGTLDLGGSVDVTFRPDFIKSFAMPGVMQLPGVGTVLDALLREDLLYAIRIRGDLSHAEPRIVPLPGLGLERGRPFEALGTAEPLPRRIPRWFR